MARATYVPITGSVLAWARREAGYTVAGLAARVKADPSDVRAWEDEAAAPTKTQFRKIVAALKRPSALFFAASPPVTTPLRASFRRASDGQGEAKAAEFVPLQLARRYQAIAEWLAAEIEIDHPPTSFLGLHARTSHSVARFASAVRAALGISFAAQNRFSSASVALREWRSATERNLGIYVFQMQFPREARGTRGFSLPSDTAPTIVLNSAFNEQARIYTLFHECAHLILRDAVVCDAWSTGDTKSSHERWAESFAASVLLPAQDFERLVLQTKGSKSGLTTNDVRIMATRTRVSVRAVALRCIELGYATWDLYERVVEETANVDYKSDSGGGGGESTALRRLREIGPRLPAILFSAREHDVIGHYDVLKYLDMDTAQAGELEGLLHESRS